MRKKNSYIYESLSGEITTFKNLYSVIRLYRHISSLSPHNTTVLHKVKPEDKISQIKKTPKPKNSKYTKSIKLKCLRILKNLIDGSTLAPKS